MWKLIKALILAALPLFTYPFAAQAGHAGENTGGLPNLGNCYDLTLVPSSTLAFSDLRQYKFQGKCVVYDSIHVPRAATILAKYDIATKTATEAITITGYAGLAGPNLPYIGPKSSVVSWQCSNDPWLVTGASCDVIDMQGCFPGNFYVQYCEGSPPPYSSTGPFPWDQPLHAPLTKPGFNAVKAYVNNTLLAEKVPPLINVPAEGQAYPAGSLTLSVTYDPPNLSNWLHEYKYPSAASDVEFHWARLQVNPDGNGATWVNEDFLPIHNLDGPGATVDTRFKEGKWRVRAKHNIDGWPWTWPWVNFWIGDKYDYTKPMATIQQPTPNEMHLDDTGSGLYQVDFLIAYVPAQSAKAAPSAVSPAVQAGQPGGSEKFEIEVEIDWYQKQPIAGKTGFGVITPLKETRTGNIGFTHYLNPGLWRVRARSAALTADGLHYPWTDWRMFNNGWPVDENGNIIFNIPPQSQSQSSQLLDPEIAKKLLTVLGGEGARQLNPAAAKAIIQALGTGGMQQVDPETARIVTAMAQGRGQQSAAKPAAPSAAPQAGANALMPLGGQSALKVTAIKMIGHAVAGQPVELLVALQNTSAAPVQAAVQDLKITCGATPGKSCAVVAPRQMAPFTLQPGQSHTLKLTVQPSAGGTYTVSVVPHDAPESSGQSVALAVMQAPMGSMAPPTNLEPKARSTPSTAPIPKARVPAPSN